PLVLGLLELPGMGDLLVAGRRRRGRGGRPHPGGELLWESGGVIERHPLESVEHGLALDLLPAIVAAGEGGLGPAGGVPRRAPPAGGERRRGQGAGGVAGGGGAVTGGG